jgi:hypothetical protein
MADDDLWRRIQAEGRWLITADKEFADLRRFPPGSHAGVIRLRCSREGLDEYLQLAGTMLASVKLEEVAGAVVVVTDRGVRVRDTR